MSCGPACGYRKLFPLTHNDDHYRMLLAEVGSELNPERRDRSYPRVVKRKMSSFLLKRAQHQQRRQTRRPPHTAITITITQQDRTPPPTSHNHLNDRHCV